jgi:hypothetical protein
VVGGFHYPFRYPVDKGDCCKGVLESGKVLIGLGGYLPPVYIQVLLFHLTDQISDGDVSLAPEQLAQPVLSDKSG